MERVAGGANFLVVQAPLQALAQIARLCSCYGTVHRLSTAEVVQFLSCERNVAALCMAWTDENRRVLTICAETHFQFPVLVLCSVPTRAMVEEAFHSGARLACLPVAEPDLRAFIESSVIIHSSAHEHSSLYERTRKLSREVGLTERERRILQAVISGGARKSVAHRLGISENTAKSHIRAILGKCRSKYEVRNLAELVNWLLRRTY